MVERADSDTIQIKVRLRESVRAELEAAAKANGWPLNREIANRLEASLRGEAALGGPVTASLLKRVAADIAGIEATSGQSWTEDYATWSAILKAAQKSFRDFAPLPPDIEKISEAVTVRDARLAELREAAQSAKAGDIAQAAAIWHESEAALDAAFGAHTAAIEQGDLLRQRFVSERVLANLRRVVGEE